MTRVLVTGGAGFIGSHTCVSLLEKKYEIIVIDSFINSHEESLKRVYEISKANNKNNFIFNPYRIIYNFFVII